MQILVIILSATLAILLVLCIVIAVQVKRILMGVEHIVQSAQKVATTVEGGVDFLQTASGPMGILRIIRGIIESVKGQNKESK